MSIHDLLLAILLTQNTGGRRGFGPAFRGDDLPAFWFIAKRLLTMIGLLALAVWLADWIDPRLVVASPLWAGFAWFVWRLARKPLPSVVKLGNGRIPALYSRRVG